MPRVDNSSPSLERLKRRRKKSSTNYSMKKALHQSREQRSHKVTSLGLLSSLTKKLMFTSIDIRDIDDSSPGCSFPLNLILESIIEVQEGEDLDNVNFQTLQVFSIWQYQFVI